MKHFSGWLRALPRGRWRKVCAALTWAGCWDKLLRTPVLASRVERVVRKGDSHPNEERRR